MLRLSGPEARRIVAASCSTGAGALAPGERAVTPVRFFDGRGEQPCLLLWMPGPRSYTREDVAELHLAGSPFLLEAALARIVELGAIPAAPGEFTRRAFLNGRLDLTRAEGVLELVSATSAAERRAATALLLGGLERRTSGLRDVLEELRALCEASLDFDESDTGHVPTPELLELAREARRRLEDACGWEERRTAHQGEPTIALVGPPNAGKSSLFNRLAEEVGEAGEHVRSALVSGVAGTTRDVVTGTWSLGGVRCRLADTAGLDPTVVGVEREAQEYSARERDAADLLLRVHDATVGEPVALEPHAIGVWNKVDASGAGECPEGWLPVSCVTGAGLEQLGHAVARQLGAQGSAGVSRELAARHEAALACTLEELDRARAGLEAGLSLDLVAEHLRGATRALDGITGRTTPEDLLDRIFARFCLGK